MGPKRKRPDDPDEAEPKAQSQPGGPLPWSTRRATRQTPVLPPPVPASALAPAAPTVAAKTRAAPSSITAVPLPPILKRAARGARPTPSTQQLSPAAIRFAPPPRADMGSFGSVGARDAGRASDLVAPKITYHVPPPGSSAAAALAPYHGLHGRPPSSLLRPHGPTVPPPRVDKVPLPPPPVVTPVPAPKPPTLSHDRSQPRTDRNIDKVVLGNLCFRTWYPSYYGKEVLVGDGGGGGGGPGAKDAGGVKASSRRGGEHHQPMLERLYVCPGCFKYAKELVAWWGHVKMCQTKGAVPGKKIYVHPRGARTVYVPHDGKQGPGAKKRRGEGAVRYVEEIVRDEGEWSIWEVDGEKDVLFCQNLSLFAKLFLDNKSVFFDVTGFNYFLLVYTPPSSAAPQITGFFSKEKMSWDNNNLACILIFPPWQRKGLGALLMSASYEISRREGVMGGPEKPLSDLGRRGYKQYWSGEICRWLLSLDTADQEEVVVDVEDCSRGTWISPEDCLTTLREMGVLEDVGMGRGKPPPPEDAGSQGSEDEETHDEGRGVKEVRRVRVDKEAVRRYVAANRVSLSKACDPNGFVDGYAMKAPVVKADVEQGEESEAREA